MKDGKLTVRPSFQQKFVYKDSDKECAITNGKYSKYERRLAAYLRSKDFDDCY